ncbi:MAG TPA: helix-turn-helix transcriptional regulator [Sphingomonas sp.]|nr:helix-turn-helix transcriptional regulator [Sphingomonas sp.]
MKRSADLPLTIRPVVGMDDSYPAGYIDGFHSHDRSQLSFALTGVMSFVTDDSTYVLPPNRAIWLPAGTRHQVSCREAVTFNLLYIDPDLPNQPDMCRVFDVSPLVRALIQEVLTFDHAYDETGREGRIVALLLDEIGRMPAIPVSAPMPRDRRLRRVCDQIVADPADQRDLDELARVAGMGRRTFTRSFRQETGMAFAMWRQQVRLMAAISLLGEGKSITSIAFDVGYESPSSFTAMFHRVLGVPPSHYRGAPE